MKNFLILTVLISLLISGCAFLAPTPKHLENYQLRATYQQGPCFGRCPIYKLSIYQNGLLLYEGERFTDKEGTWYKLLGRTEVAALLDSFTALDMSRFPSSFPSRLPDAATISMSFINLPSGERFATVFKEEANEELLRMADRMRSLAASSGFRQYVDTIRTGENLIGQTIQVKKEEIIVHLKAETNPDAWIVKYAKQEASIKEKLTPNASYYVILASPATMPIKELIDLMRRDEAVISAQRNQQLNPR